MPSTMVIAGLRLMCFKDGVNVDLSIQNEVKGIDMICVCLMIGEMYRRWKRNYGTKAIFAAKA